MSASAAISTMTHPPYRVVLLAGAVGAVIEMIPVITIQRYLFGVPPIRIFQSIASGLLGRQAYSGGLWSAIQGAALHVLISLIAALIFVEAARRWRVLLRRPVISGAIFGVLAFIVMSWIVVPLSAAAFKPNLDPALLMLSLAIHVLFFGLPIALTTHRLTSGRSGAAFGA